MKVDYCFSNICSFQQSVYHQSWFLVMYILSSIIIDSNTYSSVRIYVSLFRRGEGKRGRKWQHLHSSTNKGTKDQNYKKENVAISYLRLTIKKTTCAHKFKTKWDIQRSYIINQTNWPTRKDVHKIHTFWTRVCHDRRPHGVYKRTIFIQGDCISVNWWHWQVYRGTCGFL